MLKVHFPEFLILIRHGQTEWNKEKRMQGSIDIPLNATGRQQAVAYGGVLQQLLKEKQIAAEQLDIRVSTKKRAEETAALACQRAGINAPRKPDSRLVEQNYGLMEGKTFSEVEKTWPELWYCRLHKPLSYRPPQGESGDEFLARVADVINECQSPALLVGHFGIVRVLLALCHANGIKTTLQWEDLTGGQNIVYVVEKGALKLYYASE